MKARYERLPIAILSLMLLFCTPSVVAQGFFGTISGIVTDASGAVITGATVTVTNVDTNVVTSLKTNSAGVYNASSLNPGTYKVEAEAKGFKTAVADKIVLEVNANPKVNLSLTVGQATEVVEVTGQNTPMLQTQQTDLGQTLDHSVLQNLPIEAGSASSGRSPYSLLPLAAGVSQQTGCTGGGTGGSALGACGNEGNVRVSGSRPRTDDNILDGVSITPIVFGGQSVLPSIEAIQEFRIEQNNMSAEYGKNGGLIVIQVSKSGTNHLHGSAYLYNRNENFDAKDYFADPTLRKNPYNYNDFGASIGGAIIKDKLFFFSDYEATRTHGATVNSGVLVPNALFRSGDLGTLCTGNGGTFNNSGICSIAADQINDPNTKTAIPFNNIANNTCVGCAAPSAASAAILALWPSGGSPSTHPGINILTLNPAFTSSDNLVNPRVDWNVSQNDHVFGAFHGEYGSGLNDDIITGPAGQALSRGRNYATTIGWTHTFSTNMLNDFRFGVSHHLGDRMTFGAGTVSPSALGLTGVPNCLSSVPDTAGGTKCGTPGVSVVGYTGFTNGGMLYEPSTALHFGDTVTKLRGKHNLRWGFQADHYSIDNYQPNDVTGNFPFNGSATGNAFADYLFGVPNKSSKIQGQPTFVSSRAWSYALFLQDDIKLTPKLTLNAGLRWQYDESFHELHHGDAFFDPCAVLYSSPGCVPHWDQFGVNAPDTTLDPSKHQFEPRIGLAWNPIGGFVVRAGYGIMHPGYVGHGRAGDGQPGPNLLWSSSLSGQWDTATPNCPIPTVADITAPIPINGCTVSYQSWAPRKQYPTYTENWNLTLEQQFGTNTTLQVGYVGTKGVHLPINYAYNICQQSQASTLAQVAPVPGGNIFNFTGPVSTPYCPAAAAALNAGAGFSPGPVYFWLTINPGWWGLSSSIYHSMQAQFDHRFSRNFQMLANFTWSKLIDDSSSDWGGFWSLDALGQDFYNRKAERSVSAGDIPLRFTMAPVVQLPFGPGERWLNRGAASDVLGGWRVSGIYTISAGTPFGITDNNYGFCNGAGLVEDRPNIIGNVASISGSSRSVNLWFNNQALDFGGTCPGPGLVPVDLTPPGSCCDLTKAFGNAPRYFSNVRNPGVDSLDFSLQKDFKIPAGEQTKLTFSADFFNLPNHPNFAEPAEDPSLGYSPPGGGTRGTGFGAISGTSAITNRVIQLGLHLYF